MQKKHLTIKNKEIEAVQHKTKLGCRKYCSPHFLCLCRTKGSDVTPEAEETTEVHHPESPLTAWAEDHKKDHQ